MSAGVQVVCRWPIDKQIFVAVGSYAFIERRSAMSKLSSSTRIRNGVVLVTLAMAGCASTYDQWSCVKPFPVQLNWSENDPISDDVKEGYAAYVQSDFATAFSKFNNAALQGDARGQYQVGTMYGRGQGVPRDIKQATYWFSKAAEQGYANALVSLGGRCTDRRDLVHAMYWYNKAAEQGNATAQYELAFLYTMGVPGVPRDTVRAAYWLNEAAERGIIIAQRELAIWHERGSPSIPRDYVQSYKWLSIVGAAQGDNAVRKDLDRLEEVMTPAQVAEAQRLAREWKPR
jgi:uncharacterized protein